MWGGAQTMARHVAKVSWGVFDLTPSDKQILVKSVKEKALLQFDKRKRTVINNEVSMTSKE
jgi:hypothetical protein